MNTNWTQAVTSIEEAFFGLLQCKKYHKNVWIEVQKNGDQEYPILISNPILDDPFNWTMAYGVPRNEEEMERHHYLNDTEKDLTFNWYCAFGKKAAVTLYKNSRKVTSGLFPTPSGGIVCPVRITDIDAWRKRHGAEPFNYTWMTYWKPIEGFSHYVPADIDRVLVVCYDDKPYDELRHFEKLFRILVKGAEKWV